MRDENRLFMEMHMKKTVLAQCKDLDEFAILKYIKYCQNVFNAWATLYELSCVALRGRVVPYNLIKAKLRKMEKNHLVSAQTSCAYQITVRGNMELASYYMPPEKLSN
jgi:hypothetical protein